MYEYGDLVTVYAEGHPFCGQVGLFLQLKGSVAYVEFAEDHVEAIHRSDLRLHRKMTMSHAEARQAVA
jgi:hypothetical protein